MKRGKDDEKTMGPMFPRLNVNDTEKGGPRAPPRNKMALYEQLSIPSQRFNSGRLPLNPSNTSNLVQFWAGSDHERSVFFPLHIPPSIPTPQAEKLHTRQSDAINLNTSLAQLEQRKKVGDEDDFRVPIFVHSEMGQHHSKNQNSIDREKFTPLSPTYSGHSVKIPNSSDEDPKCTISTGPNLGQEVRSDVNPKECVSSRGHSVKSANLLTRKKIDRPAHQANASSHDECRDDPVANFVRLHDTDASLRQDYRARSRPEDTGCSDGVLDKPARDIEKGNAPRQRSDSCLGERHNSTIEPDIVNEHRGDKTFGCIQTGNVDRGDDVSETSMVDSILGLDISPDDVVGIIGQKHFWKARRAIVNQQRVFAVQVFELHRLIKVQRLIAGSPHLLLEESAYLGKPALKGSPAKKLPPEYVVKASPHIVRHKDDSEKAKNKECSAENAVGKTSFSSVKNGSQPSNYGPYSGNQPPAPVAPDNKMGPWCFHQPPGHQWLVPVMSPSEGLVYKPYPGPGFMGTVCGGCGPLGPTPMTGNLMNSAYGVPASQRHHHQGIGVLPGVPPIGHGYFLPYGMPVMNPAVSGSAVDQMNRFPGPGSHSQPGQLSGGGANFNTQHQSSYNLLSQKSGGISQFASKDSELQGSTASSPIDRAQGDGVGTGHIAEGRDALPLFPTTPVAQEGVTQSHDSDQPTRVIKVVPHNPRSATESAARIFESIQEERKQY